MTFRKITIADAPALAKAHVASYKMAYTDILPKSVIDKLTIENRTERFREVIMNNTEETYAAEIDGEIVGYITLGHCRDLDADLKSIGEIWRMYLSPQYWRKGIGKFLAEKGESMLKQRGYSEIVLWVFKENYNAKKFYEAMGFKADGAVKELTLGSPLQVVRYRKKVISQNKII